MKKTVCVVLLCALAAGAVAGEEKGQSRQQEKKELKLEDLFPEKSYFGPSADDMSFSHDGRYGAWRYRPYKERRHGSDLYVLDTESGEVRRVTWPSVMARFQASARKVVEDRIEKAKEPKAELEKKRKEQEAKAREKDEAEKGDDSKQVEQGDVRKADESQPAPEGEDEDEEDGEKEQTEDDFSDIERMDRGDWVGDKDADDDKAPRYSGIGSFVWSPDSHEMLLLSENDIYRLNVEDDSIVRLTETQDREYAVAWLQKSDGYVYRRGSSIYRVLFDSHVVCQLDPKFPNGDTMQHAEISPDENWIAFLTSKKIKDGPSSKVEIAKYRGRLMEADEVSRHVSDDPLPVYERRVYLYRLSDEPDEKDDLTEVFLCKTQLPDDRVMDPVWSPDSKKVLFGCFEQEQGLITFYEARVPEPQKEGEKGAGKDEEKDKKDEPAKPEKAEEIYTFLHHGGPNTPSMMKYWYLGDSEKIVYLSEQTGFRHLHVLDPLYESFRPLTSGPFEVYPIDISKDRAWVFVRATKEHPSRIDVYRISTETGQMTRLTREEGVYTSPAVSPDGTRVLANFASYESLRELAYLDTGAEGQKILTDSHTDKTREFASAVPEFFDYKNRHGHTIYGMMFKPEDFDPANKRPLLIYFYGGPLGTAKQVVHANYYGSAYAFAHYMAKKHGYVTCTLDPRGNSGYAGVFEKANYNQVGKPQVEDIVDGVRWFTEQGGVDPNRVAIHGWSFGGFQTQMCMYTEPDVFAAGMAGAGPTEWENYNSWYTRHTIGESEPGKANLKKFSLLPLAKNLKGHLLLVHGMEDSNVLYQDTVRVYRELLKAGKETLVELFLDPTGGHGLGGEIKDLGRYRKYEQFLLRTVGRYEASKEASDEAAGEKPKTEPSDSEKKDETVEESKDVQKA